MAITEPTKPPFNVMGLIGAIVTGAVVAAAGALTAGQDWPHVGQLAVMGAITGFTGWLWPTHRAKE